MNGLFGNKTPTEELVVKEIHGVGLNCFDRQPRRTIYALETWHIYSDRKVLAAIGWYGTKKEAERIRERALYGIKYSTWHRSYGAQTAGCKGYLTLRDQFDTEKEYLRYARTVSMHPATIDRKMKAMEAVVLPRTHPVADWRAERSPKVYHEKVKWR